VKILHHERKRLESHFSIERLFAEIRRHMPADCEVAVCSAPEASAGILPRWRNIRHAARQKADVHHIVGDSHYLAFGLPPEKTVLTIHDCGALNRLTGWKRALLKYFWFTGPMRRAAVVTTISEASKDELRKWVGTLADKVVVVPDCVFEEFAYDPKPFNEACPVVLQVGTKWNKNVERVMEAVRGTGCRLEIVGTMAKDRETKRQRDEETNRPKDQRPEVKELGQLTDGELVAAYQRCDMVVFASLYEGFGLPILEAQAMGRPVITSNFGPMREAAGDGALLVNPYSVEEIRAAILRIKREPALREDLIAKGLRNVAKFSANAVGESYAQIYKQLATD
jgi:glycosyltransferase involved in cell wall biosynthesis